MNTGTNLLKELIIMKYGEEKFDTGILLVTQWLNATTGLKYAERRIKEFATGAVTPHFPRPKARAIEKLFGKNYEP